MRNLNRKPRIGCTRQPTPLPTAPSRVRMSDILVLKYTNSLWKQLKSNNQQQKLQTFIQHEYLWARLKLHSEIAIARVYIKLHKTGESRSSPARTYKSNTLVRQWNTLTIKLIREARSTIILTETLLAYVLRFWKCRLSKAVQSRVGFSQITSHFLTHVVDGTVTSSAGHLKITCRF